MLMIVGLALSRSVEYRLNQRQKGRERTGGTNIGVDRRHLGGNDGLNRPLVMIEVQLGNRVPSTFHRRSDVAQSQWKLIKLPPCGAKARNNQKDVHGSPQSIYFYLDTLLVTDIVALKCYERRYCTRLAVQVVNDLLRSMMPAVMFADD